MRNLQAGKHLESAGTSAMKGMWRACADHYLTAYRVCTPGWDRRYITWSGYTSVLREGSVRVGDQDLLALGVGLQLLQQLCGMNAFMYYGPKIFGLIQSGAATQQQGSAHGANSMDGANSRDGAFLFTAINGVVMVLATVPGILLVDRVGRTVLLRYSAAGMLVSCLVLGIVGSSCMESAACGYAASGAIFFFVFNFAYGWGPVIWVYCAEMFPLVHRSRATGATTMANWAGNFCLAFFPPLLISTIDRKSVV